MKLVLHFMDGTLYTLHNYSRDGVEGVITDIHQGKFSCSQKMVIDDQSESLINWNHVKWVKVLPDNEVTTETTYSINILEILGKLTFVICAGVGFYTLFRMMI